MILATLDLETDPFAPGKIVKPFVAGFYDGTDFMSIWGLDCVTRMVAYLASKEGPYLIYAHNGGKFDFFFFLPYLNGALRIINSRIVSALLGPHEVRDSYAIMPFPLREYDKDQIDYEKMSVEKREKNRKEIISYLRKDCTALHELVVAFHDEFGDNLTIGSAALKQLKKRHKFKCGREAFDAKFRKDFYFGGRVQCFKSGIVRMPVSIYDVNSMYPDVMKRALHPVDTSIIIDKRIKTNTCFVVAEGKNYGAFPIRGKDGSLDFTAEQGRFSTTIHEWNAAEETGTFRAKRIVKTYGSDNRITFSEYVDYFYGARKLAKFNGDKIHSLFYKYTLNSSYGKFAQNPENFADYVIRQRTEPTLPEPWLIAYMTDDYIIWKKPTDQKHYYNISTGASITGAARAMLLKGLQNATDPIYCDTDSIICRTMRNVDINDSELGAWKLEATGTLAAICGKKLYCVIDENCLFGCTCKTATKENPCGFHVKKAHKGGILTYAEILRVAKGETITVAMPVPAFKFDGTVQFTTRRIRRTA